MPVRVLHDIGDTDDGVSHGQYARAWRESTHRGYIGASLGRKEGAATRGPGHDGWMTTVARSEDRARPLPGGLLLRGAGPQDLAQIGELLVDRGEPFDAVDHQLVVEDPEYGWGTCAVVVDGDRVVSTATLLAERVHLSTAAGDGTSVTLPAGQVELVATRQEYEGRGLVRALMAWAHEQSLERGDVLQVMVGIPYFYRLFGYSYAIDIPARRDVHHPVAVPEGVRVRAATASDLPALGALQDRAQAVSEVRMPHPAARLRWLLAHEGSTTWVVERAGSVVGTGRTTAPDDGVLLAEVAAEDASAATALIACAQALDPPHGVRVAERPGTAITEVLAEHAAPPSGCCEQYYVRIPSLSAVVDAVRPVLTTRLAASGLDRDGRDVVLSTFGSHVRMPVTGSTLGAPVAGGVLQAPGSVSGCGVAPDQLGSVLFGPLGIEGLTRRQPDVYPGRDHELFAALFPPVTSDLLTYYLP